MYHRLKMLRHHFLTHLLKTEHLFGFDIIGDVGDIHLWWNPTTFLRKLSCVSSQMTCFVFHRFPTMDSVINNYDLLKTHGFVDFYSDIFPSCFCVRDALSEVESIIDLWKCLKIVFIDRLPRIMIQKCHLPFCMLSVVTLLIQGRTLYVIYTIECFNYMLKEEEIYYPYKL